MEGFVDRLLMELIQLEAERPQPNVVAPLERKLLPWSGGSALSQMAPVQSHFVSRDQHNSASASASGYATPLLNHRQSPASSSSNDTLKCESLSSRSARTLSLNSSFSSNLTSRSASQRSVGRLSPKKQSRGSTSVSPGPIRRGSMPYDFDLANLPESGILLNLI